MLYICSEIKKQALSCQENSKSLIPKKQLNEIKIRRCQNEVTYQDTC